MPYRILADAVVVVHILFVGFVVVGAFLAFRWRRVLWLHAPAALWGAWVELSGRVCPLTPLENRFRALAGLEGYAGSFVDRYLVPALYPGTLTRETQVALGLLVLAFNALVYYRILGRRT